MANEVIGVYEVHEQIGEGAMGTVYRGRDPRFDRDVALKILHPQFSRDPDVAQRFKAEAVIQAKLNHPGIVTVFDFVAENGTLAIVMEYIEGESLDRLIRRDGALPLRLCRALLAQALSAIGFAHSRELVHRDLKPSNIMMQELDGETIARVMDFGIAKILGSEKMRTATSAKIGTLAYMSPEQIQSPKHVDHRSDIYSLGATLYEMLTGELPFEGSTEYEIMKKVVETEPQPPSRKASSVPPGLDALVLKALAKERSDRFQSCREFREILLDLVPKEAGAEGRRPEASSLPPAVEAPLPALEPPPPAVEPPSPEQLAGQGLKLRAPGALASLICGIAGFTPLWGIPLSVLALLFARKALQRIDGHPTLTGRRLAKTGRILGVLGLVWAAVIGIIIAAQNL